MVDILASAVESLNYDIESELTCDQCDSRFRKMTSLKRHIDHEHSVDVVKNHEETRKDKFNCKLCESTFLRERNLKLHMRMDHNVAESNQDNFTPSEPSRTQLMEVTDEFVTPAASDHSDGGSTSEGDLELMNPASSDQSDGGNNSEGDLLVNGEVITMDDIAFTTEEVNKDHDEERMSTDKEHQEESKKEGNCLEDEEETIEDSPKSVENTEDLDEKIEDHAEDTVNLSVNTEESVENTDDLVEYTICPDTGDMIPVEKEDGLEDEGVVFKDQYEKDYSKSNIEDKKDEKDDSERKLEEDLNPMEEITEQSGDNLQSNIEDKKDKMDDSERKSKEDLNSKEEMSEQSGVSTVIVSQDEDLLPENFFQAEDFSGECKESTATKFSEEEFIPENVTLEKDEHSGVDNELVLNGEAIVMDDIAYNILSSTLDQNEDKLYEKPTKKRRRRTRNIPVEKVDIIVKSEVKVQEMFPTVTEKHTVYSMKGEKRKKAEEVDYNEFESKEKKHKKYASQTLSETNIPSHAAQLIKSIPKSTRIVFSPCPGASPKVIARGSSYNLPSLRKSVKITAVPDNNSPKHGGTPFDPVKNVLKRVVGVKPSPEKILLSCEQCPGLRFQWKKQLREHIIAEHSYKCELCKKKFEALSVFNGHMESHKARCDKCPEVFNSKNDLIGHKRDQHTVKCTKCKHTFDSDDKCKQHMKKEHEFKCTHCGVVFDYQVRLEQHTRKDHTFPCSSCGVVNSTQALLDLHEKEKHSSCEVCEDEFSWAEPGHSCFYTKNNIRPLRM